MGTLPRVRKSGSAAVVTAKGVLKVLFGTMVATATIGACLMVTSGENMVYVLISFTTLESPPISPVPIASIGAFFLALAGMLMISTIVSYTLTLKSSEDLGRKLEGLEAEVRNITIEALEDIRRSLEASIRETRTHLDKRVEEGVRSLEQAFEEAFKGLLKMIEVATVTVDELMKARIEELKSVIVER